MDTMTDAPDDVQPRCPRLAPPDDVLVSFASDLSRARREASRWLDRADALAALLAIADAAASSGNRLTLTGQELLDAPATERERAELHSLIARAYNSNPNGTT